MNARDKKSKLYFKKHPWLKSFYAARQRVNGNNPKHHLYKSLCFSITKEDVEYLWNRDKASEMKKPSIDRIDSKVGYRKDNCRFIEISLNSGRNFRELTHCSRGHEFTEENTYLWRGNRKCRICRSQDNVKSYEVKKLRLKLSGEKL